MPPPQETPSSILIVGCGVFGLSTAYALTKRPEFANTQITVIDRSNFPASDGSSIDSSRIIRADYPDPAYAQLMAEGLPHWRGDFGAEGRYTESGLCIVMEDEESSDSSNSNAKAKAKASASNGANLKPKDAYWLRNVLSTLTSTLNLRVGPRSAGGQVTPFSTEAEAREAMGTTRGFIGSTGYINWTSGWAHAENGMRYMHSQASATDRITFLTASASRLLFSANDHRRVLGVELVDGRCLHADLTFLAAGAWTPSLIDLRGIASATGQILAYIALSEEEQSRLAANPVILCGSNSFFIMPPVDRMLKVARHGYGYANPVEVPHPEPHKASSSSSSSITVSLPRTKHDDPSLQIAPEGLQACREFLAKCVPELAERPWHQTRICWYTDTPKGDWLIDYHPEYQGLFVATGGSGHGYKFLPVIGERIVDLILGQERDDLGAELKAKWNWPEEKFAEDHVWTTDWRGGRKGMKLDEELAK